MPNRLIRDSVCTSDSINELTFFEEVVFYRLIVSVDDYGRLDARPDILKAKLFPLKRGVNGKQIADAVRKLAELGTLIAYEVGGKPYLQFRNWDSYQRVRNSIEKYPAPPSAASCGELRRVAASCGELRPESIIHNPESIIHNPGGSAQARTPAQNKYGEYKNVKLTEDEYTKLQTEYPDYQARIERLSEYIAKVGDKYKSHYAVIRSWARKDAEKDAEKVAERKENGSFDEDEFFEAALRRSKENTRTLVEEYRAKTGQAKLDELKEKYNA